MKKIFSIVLVILVVSCKSDNYQEDKLVIHKLEPLLTSRGSFSNPGITEHLQNKIMCTRWGVGKETILSIEGAPYFYSDNTLTYKWKFYKLKQEEGELTLNYRFLGNNKLAALWADFNVSSFELGKEKFEQLTTYLEIMEYIEFKTLTEVPREYNYGKVFESVDSELLLTGLDIEVGEMAKKHGLQDLVKNDEELTVIKIDSRSKKYWDILAKEINEENEEKNRMEKEFSDLQKRVN